MSSNANRAEFILQELVRNGQVSSEALSQQLQVNSSTIRRDLERLERQNLLRRVHGGAVPVDTLSYSTYANELTFQKNMNKQMEEKTRIAARALQLISPGDAIALSPGTTTTLLARALRQAGLPDLTVVTNALNIAMELSSLPSLTLTLTGGLLLPDFFALVGPLAEHGLGQMHIPKAFIGVTGLHPEHGLTGPNQLEALTHRVTIQRSQQVILLADSTKLGQIALHAVAPIEVVHTLITDQQADPGIVAALRDKGITVYMT